MTIHEKTIRESIERCKKELAETDAFINARPLNELLELRNEGQEWLKKWRADEISTAEISEKVAVAAGKEKELLALAETQNGGFLAALERKYQLIYEMDRLVSEMQTIERKKTI